MKLLNIFGHYFLYILYGDDRTFFNRNKNSVIELLNVFDIFSVVSGLTPNKSKCEIARVGNLKGVCVVLSGLKCINLMNEAVKILGFHFSHNKTLQQENRERLESMENETSNFRRENNVFKSLTISKIIHLVLVTPISRDITNHLNTIQKKFL